MKRIVVLNRRKEREAKRKTERKKTSTSNERECVTRSLLDGDKR